MMVRLILSACLLCLSFVVQAARNDVLVIVNDNSIDSTQVGEYYAQQRDINPANIVHIKTTPGFYMTWSEFINMRDQIIHFMQVNTFTDPQVNPITCANSTSPYYCVESMQQMREQTSIRYLVTTKGVPTRVTVDNSELGTQPASVDNYLKFWLLNYYDTDVILSSESRAIAFGDGRGMREVNPLIDNEFIVGRIDGLTLESAKSLIDRTISVERNGIYGKHYGSVYGELSSTGARWLDISTNKDIYGDSQTGWRYQLGLFGENRNECIDYLNYPNNSAEGKSPQDCAVKLTLGQDRAPGWPASRQELVDDALFYLGSLDGQSTAGGAFNNLLNWRKDAFCTDTLCENAADPVACRAASNDLFKEINTQCVGVADGFMGYNFQSYPVSMYTIWPTGWSSKSTDTFGVAFPNIRETDGFDDSYSLWFENKDQVTDALCYTGTDFTVPASQPCNDDRRLSFYQTISPGDTVVNYANPQTYRISLRFKTENLTNINSVNHLRVNLRVREKSGGSDRIDYGNKTLASLPSGNHDWSYAEVEFVLDPAKHTHPELIYDLLEFSIITSGTFTGALGLDTVSIQEVTQGVELATNGSFTGGYKQTGPGDHAANYLDRLGGVAFWGSLSHHESGGYSFSTHPMSTLIYFMRGLPLGDAVWFNERHNSGVLYGDPLYSPIAVKFEYLDNAGDRVVNSMPIVADTINGRDNSIVTTSYQVDYCSGNDFFECDQQNSWVSTSISGAGGVDDQYLGDLDFSQFPYGDYTLRLAVTSNNTGSAKSQTFYDYYPVKHKYAADEISTYYIAGHIRDANGQAVPDVTVHINDNVGFASSVTTDANGYFKKTGLRSGSYIVYPLKDGYSISPITGNIFQTIADANIPNRDFLATQVGSFISGRILDTNAQPLPGVRVQVNDNFGFASEVVTNADGFYEKTSLANGTYLVYPILEGFQIVADSGSPFVVISGSSVSNRDYTGTKQGLAVSGTILDNNGAPMPGINVFINNSTTFSQSVVTNTNGFYISHGLEPDLYVVIPMNPDYTIGVNEGTVFTPLFDTDVVNKDFTATKVSRTYFIAGYIMENGQPLSGVTVQINDNFGFASEVTTDSAGFYKKDGLANGFYLVYPIKPGYQFTSVKGTVFQTINDANVIEKDFNAVVN